MSSTVDVPPAEQIAVILTESLQGHVEYCPERHGTYWTSEGTKRNVTTLVAGMETAGLLYRSLHTTLWRPTATGLEAIDRGGV